MAWEQAESRPELLLTLGGEAATWLELQLPTHLELLVAVRVGLHGLAHHRGELQLLLLQRGPELGGQDDGRQGEGRLLLGAQPRLLLLDVAVDPPRVGHVLGVGVSWSGGDVTPSKYHEPSLASENVLRAPRYLQHDFAVVHV